MRMRTVWISLATQALAGTGPAAGAELAVRGWGLSLGNTPRANGVRLSLADAGIERVTGVNLTLWRSANNRQAVYRGAVFGLAPQGGSFAGVSAGILGLAAHGRLSGVALSAVGTCAPAQKGVMLAALNGVGLGGPRLLPLLNVHL